MLWQWIAIEYTGELPSPPLLQQPSTTVGRAEEQHRVRCRRDSENDQDCAA